jgi:hypothetical protein
MIGKILGLASLGEVLTGVSLTTKFMTSFIVIVALTIVASTLASSLIILTLYEICTLFIRHGMDSDLATLLTALLALAILVGIILSIVQRAKKMRPIPIAASGVENMGSAAISAFRGFYKGWSDKI